MKIVDALKEGNKGCFVNIGIFYKNKRLVYYDKAWHVLRKIDPYNDFEIHNTNDEDLAIEKLLED